MTSRIKKSDWTFPIPVIPLPEGVMEIYTHTGWRPIGRAKTWRRARILTKKLYKERREYGGFWDPRTGIPYGEARYVTTDGSVWAVDGTGPIPPL